MRKMSPDDWGMVCDALSDYPYTKDGGHITPEKVDGYMRRWFQQFNPYVFEVDGEAVGFINYQMQGIFLVITHAAVIPSERGKGHFKAMYQELAEKLRSEGHERAFFSVLEQSEFILSKFERYGEGDGQTGKVFYGTTDGQF